MSRSGAPIVLLTLMKWLNQNQSQVIIELLALRGGDLKEEFLTISDKFYEFTKSGLISKVNSKLGMKNHRTRLLHKLAKKKYDIIYANTVISIPVAVEIKNRNLFSKIVAHIHELSSVISLSKVSLIDLAPKVDQFIAVSELVRSSLLKTFFIPEKKVETIYEFISEKLKDYDGETKKKTFVVGASGTFHWRKGSDIFVQVARYIHSKYPDVNLEFCWVGKLPETDLGIAQNDIQKLGLENRINFTGLLINPLNKYREFDIFLLPSREDPFPLVCIEVGMMGKPIICFENASGTEEILKNGGGFVVPYLDVEYMAEKIISYHQTPNLLKEHGIINRKRFAQFTAEKQCPKIFDLINGCF